MNERFRGISEWFLDLIFPPLCASCHTSLFGDEARRFLCADCAQKLISYTTFLCGVCGARLPNNRTICHMSAPYILAPAARYESPVKDWITGLKFNRIRGYVRPLATLMETYLQRTEFDFTTFTVIPIPLHPNRERSRGFNQAAKLGLRIADFFHLSFDDAALRRIKFTRPQTDMKTFEERAANLENAFQVSDKAAVEGKNILLIDDVFTSGKTAEAAAEALKAAGARKIILAVVARAA